MTLTPQEIMSVGLTDTEYWLMVLDFLKRMVGAMVAIGMLGFCAGIGAWICGIDIKKAVDRVEKNPLAFSILVTGHFIGAALVVSSAW